MIRDYETQRVHEAPVTVLRVTPRDEAGNSVHRWAYTFRFDDPLFLAIATVTALEPITPVARPRPFIQSARVYGAIIADDSGPTDPHGITALTYALWQRRHHGAVLEAWAEINPISWAYFMIPAWCDDEGTDRWDVEEPPHRQVCAVGKMHTVNGYTWPEPGPFPETPEPWPQTRYVTGVTPIRPPAPGYSVLTPQPARPVPTMKDGHEG